MRKVILFIFVLFLSVSLNAQVTPKLISFDTVTTKTIGSKTFYVKNPTNKTLQITNIRTLTGYFYFTQSSFNINPNDSVLVTVYFKTLQNVNHRDFLIFEGKGINSSIINYSFAIGKFPELYYLPTQGLYDEALKTAIKTYTTTGYTSLGYDVARDNMFATIDKYFTNDTIECVYSGKRIRAVNRTEAQNQGFNTEHTYPQSFFNELEPMKSDLFHLYPTDGTPNSCRSNWDFNKVFTITSPACNVGGSKLGTDSTSEIVYEPRDKHKGNVARSLFYFCIKYGSIASPGGFMGTKQENRLRIWNYSDTVDANERLRNTRIAVFQHVRNPFIDHPELVDRIVSTFSVANRTPAPKISASPFNVVFDTLAVNDTASYYLAVMNYGTANLNVTSAASSIPQFTVESIASPIASGQLGYIRVKFRPTAINTTYNGTLTILNSDSTITVNLKGSSNNSIGIHQVSSEVPKETKLFQNYPNPFNPATIIRFQIEDSRFVTLKVYDMLGKEVATLVNEKLQAGIYEIPFSINQFSGNQFSSGMYFYKLETENFSQTNKLIILK
ncbi:MAG: endonuclease [Ignavibacteriae bacterium]|nr:endonuclease [Ignavibacteriota bacterium]